MGKFFARCVSKTSNFPKNPDAMMTLYHHHHHHPHHHHHYNHHIPKHSKRWTKTKMGKSLRKSSLRFGASSSLFPPLSSSLTPSETIFICALGVYDPKEVLNNPHTQDY